MNMIFDLLFFSVYAHVCVLHVMAYHVVIAITNKSGSWQDCFEKRIEISKTLLWTWAQTYIIF